jgi:hypothetical protein
VVAAAVRVQLRALLLAAPLIAALALSSVAAAQSGASNPFSPGLPSAPAPTTTATTPTIVNPPTSSTSGGGLSGGDAVAIAIGAVVLLGGISFFIWRDARRRAPVRHHPAAVGAGKTSLPGSKRVKPRKLSPAERRRRKRGRAR